MSYLNVLDKKLLESLARIQPLQAAGERAKPIIMGCYHDCRDMCEGSCIDNCAMYCSGNCANNCTGGSYGGRYS